MTPERIVQFRPRTILVVAGVLLAIGVAIWVVLLAHRVLIWILISAFLALALDPAVRFFQRRGVSHRGSAAGIVYVIALVVITAMGALFIPSLVSQVEDLTKAVPGYVQDLTRGRGPFGFLETKYHVVERVRDAIGGSTGGGGGGDAASKLAPQSAATALALGRTVLTGVAAAVTIAFMTFFMLLEGPAWMERFFGLLPENSQPRWRAVGSDIAKTVSGYVTGNLLISLVAGVSSAIVLTLLGVPFSLALGLLVAILDLIPLAGATIGAVICVLVTLTVSTQAALIALVFFVVYQQLENHLLQPVIYGRTVELSPLAVLIAVLIGAELAGIVGALGAIPVAGAIQIVLVDWHRHRMERRRQAHAEGAQSMTTATATEPRFTHP
jgi:predicted PurR-regulated permease PerM